ncbi:PREDICTED: zinc finger BED domain-containing protein 3 [Elephantulus edwardii]|uniref:zinc finger BED domain-containing protein 3 n=1 Tax=Elephantulus edwardii TaxID=28737 RepID=UPI0003F0DFA1|nr:PREDICTED: zinc finger BED domain-containing protein 3 [Elephantulus edwardii]
MEETGGLDDAAAQGVAPPDRLGAPYSEAWGYFHLAPARPGQATGHWATCRLCGEQAAVQQGERALERRRRALQAEERALAQARRELQAEREALLREMRYRECAVGLTSAPLQTPLKEELDGGRDDYIVTKVLL